MHIVLSIKITLVWLLLLQEIELEHLRVVHPRQPRIPSLPYPLYSTVGHAPHGAATGLSTVGRARAPGLLAGA